MRTNRRTILLGATATALTAGVSRTSWAQAIPDRPITLIVPYPGGGSGDMVARVIAAEMSKSLNRPIVVLNKPGAGSIVGTTDTAKAAPDGTTMLFAANSSLVSNIALYDSLPYDPMKDFAPVARLVGLPFMLAATTKAPFNTLKEMVAYAKANPDKVTRASAGVTNMTNIGMLYVESIAGFKTWHVPYAGDAAAMQALLAGEVDTYTTTVAMMRQHVLSGKIKGLAILGTNAIRDDELPNVPTTTEAGFPDFDVDSWFSLVVPAKTPPAIIAQLNKAANDALRSDLATNSIKKAGFVPTGGTPEDLQKLVDDNRNRWVPAIRKLNIKADKQ